MLTVQARYHHHGQMYRLDLTVTTYPDLDSDVQRLLLARHPDQPDLQRLITHGLLACVRRLRNQRRVTGTDWANSSGTARIIVRRTRTGHA